MTITKTSNTETDERLAVLREEYRISLRLWSETKALYAADSAEVQSATEQLATLETELTTPEPIAFEHNLKQLETRA